ncbi:MAG: FKBP-type peptidyl-prolyl cis-trans isomerase [Patescibacteria group bacterium]|nr:FKBP-type peptidyl-prolyl cis-trans isomerase [Patescibacteria group bacterium]
MSRRTLVTGIAVALALAVVVVFFIFNPFTMQSNPALNPAAGQGSTGAPASLVVQDEVVGTGAAVQPGDTVTVNYTGKLQDGTVFDTSVGRAPFQFTVGAGQVIPGWDQGLVGMQAGGKRILIIPPSLAYGAQGAGPIPPNATLTFEVDLLSITPASSTAPIPEGPAAQ